MTYMYINTGLYIRRPIPGMKIDLIMSSVSMISNNARGYKLHLKNRYLEIEISRIQKTLLNNKILKDTKTNP